jgi:hypothetical protein
MVATAEFSSVPGNLKPACSSIMVLPVSAFEPYEQLFFRLMIRELTKESSCTAQRPTHHWKKRASLIEKSRGD